MKTKRCSVCNLHFVRVFCRRLTEVPPLDFAVHHLNQSWLSLCSFSWRFWFIFALGYVVFWVIWTPV